jgi:5-methylthioadenosine/S-adenosylhomocysteine deaminase
MIAGVIRYEDGRFNIGVDPHDLYLEADNIKARIRNELGR